MCCILYYHFVYGVLSYYVDDIDCIWCYALTKLCVRNCFIILYIAWNVYLDYFYIYGDCSPVRFLEVNKETKNENLCLPNNMHIQ
jgi:hypothetical protein